MKYLYLNKHWRLDKEYNIDKILYLMIDRPNEIEFDINFIWTNNNCLQHRDYDLPADIFINDVDYDEITCDLRWYNNDKTHREKSKPAIIYIEGYKEYYINGKFIKEEK